MSIGSKHLRGFIVLLAIAIISGGGYGFYCSQAKTTFSQAINAIENQDWHTAQESLLTMKNVYMFSLPDQQKNTMNYLSLTNLFLKLETAIENEDATLAISTYDEIITVFPKTAEKLKIEEEKYNYMLQTAEALHGMNYFDQAKQLYKLIAREYPDSPVVEMVKEDFPQIRLDQALFLREEEDFETTTDILMDLGKENLEFADKNNVEEELMNTYLLWADTASENNNCDVAFNKYDYIQYVWPDTEIAENAYDKYLVAGLKCAETYHEEHNFTKEVEVLQTLKKEYVESEEIETINENLLNAYKAYGDQLMNSGEFFSAMMYYETLMEDMEDVQQKEEISEKNERIKQILLTDEGPEGQKVINKIREEFCNGSREFPSIIDDVPSTANKAVLCSGFLYDLPESKTAQSLSELKFVIDGTENERDSANCPYTDGYWLTQIQYYYTMQLYDVVHKTPSKRGNVYGTPAPYCPATFSFRWSYEEEYGEKVTEEQIDDWLKSVLP
jgi:hypothetical protein